MNQIDNPTTLKHPYEGVVTNNVELREIMTQETTAVKYFFG